MAAKVLRLDENRKQIPFMSWPRVLGGTATEVSGPCAYSYHFWYSVLSILTIREHFQDVHRLFQCVRCYSIFTDAAQLQSHCRWEQCQRMPESFKEGIDESDWPKVEAALRVRRGKCKGRSDVERWFDVWDILFPGSLRPDHPCECLHKTFLSTSS